MPVVLKHVSLKDLDKVNTNNIPRLCPYHLDGDVLYIDPVWFHEELTSQTKNNIYRVAEKMGWIVEYSGTIDPTKPKPVEVYREYVDQFDYDRWDVSMIRHLSFHTILYIPEDARQGIKDIACLFACGRHISDETIRDRIPATFLGMLEDQIMRMKNHGGVFIKTSRSSFKNFRALRPVHSGLDAIRYMTETKESTLDQHRCWILMPWENWAYRSFFEEFRVFIYKRKVTAVSRQKWFEPSPHSLEWQLRAVQKIVDLVKQFSDELWFASAVADIYVVGHPAGTLFAHLIELNPWGGGFSSGGALFDWVSDDSILTSDGSDVVLAVINDVF